MATARRFADALDAEDYPALSQLLTRDCEYLSPQGARFGPQAIVVSYRGAGTWAQSKIEKIRYRSNIRRSGEDTAVVTLIDLLEHHGVKHEYACEQTVSVNAAGGVYRIVHSELPGQREAADAFLRSIGVNCAEQPDADGDA